MAFQDFGHLSERRKAERAQKLKKRIAIGAISTIVVILIIGSAIGAVVYKSDHKTTSKQQDENTDIPKSTTGQVSTSTKAVAAMCASTDYKKSCEKSLSKAVDSDSAKPKDILKAAVKVVVDEIKKTVNQSSKFRSNDPAIKGALEVCDDLIGYAIDDLKATLKGIDVREFSNLAEKSNDLKSWMSAAYAYQDQCIEGFPDGEFKKKMFKALNNSKELTSNALAIVNQVATFVESLEIPGITKRRLLEAENNAPTVDEESLPDWMTGEERRVLEEQAAGKLKPDVVVAKDGSGQYTSISDALAMMPKKYMGRYVIYVKAGEYNEAVIIEKKMWNVTMYGDGARKTIITAANNFVDGMRTYQTATFAAIGDGFIAKDMTFRNTAGAIKHQAVALRVQSDRSVFLNCRMEGYQDTLYVQTHRQFYRSCVIAGTIDFIFGDAAAIFQKCTLVVRKPLDNQKNIVTAQGRSDRHENTGIVLQHCVIKADKKLVPLKKKIESYLGRPWKEYSRTIIMESTMEDLIHPDGWLPWEGDFALKTLAYAEYNNDGPGASTNARVKWPGYKVINRKEAMKYTVAQFLDGAPWAKAAGATVDYSLVKK